MRNRLNAAFAKRSYNRCGCATFFLRSIHTARIASRRRVRGKKRRRRARGKREDSRF